MSRTNHHYRQHQRHFGRDFGARYKWNRHYGGGTGPEAKNAADIERRIEGKSILIKELNEA